MISILMRIFCFILLAFTFLIKSVWAENELELLDQVIFPTGLMFENTEVGGLSGISYAPGEDSYYVISDDRSFRQPARFYRLTIDISENRVKNSSVKITGVTLLQNEEGKTFKAGSVDPEGIAVAGNGRLFISSEGVTGKLIPPFVALFSSAGRQLKTMTVPEKFLPTPDGNRGVRDNMGFESLTLSADGRFLTTASENALVQDGSKATLTQRSPSRLIIFAKESGKVVNEYIYLTDPVPEAPAVPGALHVNGLVELVALEDEGCYLALERAYSEGEGFNIRLYRTFVKSKDDADLPLILSKELVLNFDTLGIPLDNLEGMSFGPDLPDGRRSLVVISDNNFSRKQFTQILVFAVEADSIHPTVLQ
ncbi:MAG: esterase-like activity of phytase family protein [Deltaproteobacteria bacterium]|nr:esterase-like activity of phytase family protein [Deltaproteobacteria bacterium]